MTGEWLPSPVPDEIGPHPKRSGAATGPSGVLHVDCDRCSVRGAACGECVISVLLGPPGAVEQPAGGQAGQARQVGPDVVIDRVDLNLDEQSALAALAGSGMVPPLRLVTALSGPDPWSADVGGDGHLDRSVDGRAPAVTGQLDDQVHGQIDDRFDSWDDGWGDEWGDPGPGD